MSFITLLSNENYILQVLVLNLKKTLYLSIKKSVFLNKVHFNILNSFEDNKVRNKPFKPLLNASTRIKYFNFFSQFLIFFYRALKFNSRNNIFFFKINNSIITIISTLNKLVNNQLILEENKENYLKQSNLFFKKHRKSINNKLNK